MHREGFLSFWKGNGVSVIHRFPYSAINFWCFENFQNTFSIMFGSKDEPKRNPAIRFMVRPLPVVLCIALLRGKASLPLFHTALTTTIIAGWGVCWSYSLYVMLSSWSSTYPTGDAAWIKSLLLRNGRRSDSHLPSWRDFWPLFRTPHNLSGASSAAGNE